MAKSYTTLRSLYGVYTKNSSTANLVNGAIFLNDGYRLVLADHDWSFLELSKSFNSIAGQQYYKLPANLVKLKSLNTLIGNLQYFPDEVIIEQDWNRVNTINSIQGNIAQYFFIRGQISGGREIGIWPIPSSDMVNFINITYKRAVPDLSIADYTSGTITSCGNLTGTLTVAPAIGDLGGTLTGVWAYATGTYTINFSSGEVRTATFTSASATVTWTDALTAVATVTLTVSSASGGAIVIGATTTWTAGMAGAHLKITPTFSAKGGDGIWYEISDFYSTTQLGLVEPYDGTALDAATAVHTIASLPYLPEEFQLLPVYYASEQYWMSTGNDLTRAAYFRKLFEDGSARLFKNFANKNTNPVISDSMYDRPIVNNNNYPWQT